MLLLTLLLLIAETLSSQPSNGGKSEIHKKMTPKELLYFFDVTDPAMVDTGMYHILHVGHEEVTGLEKRGGATHHANVKMEAFGKTYHLKLRKNSELLYEKARIVITDEEEIRPSVESHGDCHYAIDDDEIIGGISLCHDEYHGFFKDEEDIFDILPLNSRLHDLLPEEHKGYHMVRKSATYLERLIKTATPDDDAIDIPEDEPIDDELPIPNGTQKILRSHNSRSKRADRPDIIIETGLFFDCKAYKIYNDYYHDQDKLIDLLLSLMNGMQSVFHYPTLGRKVSFCIVYVEMQKKCLIDDAVGERENMLMNFCAFQKKVKAREGLEWDMGLLMSGRDMWGKTSRGGKSYATMGLSTVTGVCEEDYGCVIGEMGVRDPDGKPYPSAGYLTVFIMVHEIAHNLGMHHDGTTNSCEREGSIMSPTRGTAGECVWSDCSKQVIQSLDMPCLYNEPSQVIGNHDKYHNNPGRYISSNEQCKLLMRDSDAITFQHGADLSQICDHLLCKSPNKKGTEPAGPALTGTPCGNGKHCWQGQCEKRDFNDDHTGEAKWSEWQDGSCEYNCIKGSIGTKVRRRRCMVPPGTTSYEDCQGPASKVVPCTDFTTSYCREGDREVNAYASSMCVKFRQASSRLNKFLTDEGEMMKFNRRFAKRTCIIHCKLSSNGFYGPVVELDQRELEGYSPFFPDGTLCNDDNGRKMYCMKGVCQPPNTKTSRTDDEDLYNVVQYARPNEGQGEEPDPFFITKEDGSPMGLPKIEVDFDPKENEFEMEDEIGKW